MNDVLGEAVVGVVPIRCPVRLAVTALVVGDGVPPVRGQRRGGTAPGVAGLPPAVDQDDRIGDAYGVTGLPTTLFLDRQGRLAATWAGPVTEAELQRITAGLAEPS